MAPFWTLRAGGLLLTLGLLTRHVWADRPSHGAETKQVSGASTFYLGQRRASWKPLVHIAVNLSQINSIKSTFQLRTYDPEGAVFYGDTEEGKEWFILALRDGRPLMLLYRKEVLVHVSGGPRLNDGQWHTLEVSNQGNHVVLEVDGARGLVMGMHSQHLRDVVYTKLRLGLGGILIPPARVHVQFDPHLDGCVRAGSFLNLTLPWELDAAALWPCPSLVQPGVFFPGAGLAILNATALPGEELKLQLLGDFRRMDGTILSARAPSNELLFSVVAHNSTQEISFRLRKVGLRVKNTRTNLTLSLREDRVGIFEDGGDLAASTFIPIRRDESVPWAQARFAIGGLLGEAPDDSGSHFLTGCFQKILVQGQLLDLDSTIHHQAISSHSCPA